MPISFMNVMVKDIHMHYVCLLCTHLKQTAPDMNQRNLNKFLLQSTIRINNKFL